MSTIHNATRRLTCGFVNGLDSHDMLSRLARLRGSALRRLALGRAIAVLLFVTALSVAGSQKAYSQKPPNIMNIKLYAYNKLSWDQFQCYNWLIHHESRWNYKAVNGSHYGLGQMRSKWVSTLTPFKQIDVHIRYLKHRYSNEDYACKALAHWERKGWH